MRDSALPFLTPIGWRPPDCPSFLLSNLCPLRRPSFFSLPVPRRSYPPHPILSFFPALLMPQFFSSHHPLSSSLFPVFSPPPLPFLSPQPLLPPLASSLSFSPLTPLYPPTFTRSVHGVIARSLGNSSRASLVFSSDF